MTAIRRTPMRGMLAGRIRAELGIDALRNIPWSHRGPLPFSVSPIAARPEHARASAGLSPPERKGAPRSVFEFQQAYASGRSEPEAVVRRALAAARELAGRSPTLGPLCAYDDPGALAAARASAEHLARGAPRSVLEGVPIAIKEELDVVGLPSRKGTGYAGHPLATRDAVVVERLRRAGAVVLGHTPMTEFGLSPLGANPHRRMPRNPHDPARLAGGSSTGSAVSVALGVTPVSVGTDAGGSIRVPSAYCGVFGLKPTYGRIPLSGLDSAGALSVVHLGPIATSSAELATFLELTAGPDASDPASHLAAPFAPGELTAALGRGVAGLTIGIEPKEWADAPRAIRRAGEAALDALVREGARLVEIHSELMRWATAIGYLTLGIEGFVALSRVRAEHFDELGLEVQLVLAGLETFRHDDYVDAQRLRSALRLELAEHLREVDLIALPSAACTPLTITESEARYGFIDPPALHGTCRFAFLANVTGLPATSAPVGVDEDGLPIGLQFIGDAWDEACVLQAVAHLERLGVARTRAASATVDLLD